jgi:O-antigen/teichoic acid export membrane protein
VVSGQALAFFLLPFVTRALTPEAYGEYALALAVSGFAGVLASAWIRNVGLRLYFDALNRGTTRGLFTGMVLLQAVSFVVVYGAVLAVMNMAGTGAAPWRVQASAGVTMLLGDLAGTTLMLLRAERSTFTYAVGEIGAGLLRFVFTLTGLALGFQTAELLFDATSLGLVIASTITIPVLWRRLIGPAAVDVRGVREILRHGPASLPFAVGDWTERLADRLVIEHFLGTAVVGIYSVGYTVGERTVGALERAVFMMAWPNILAAWRDGGPVQVRAAIDEALRLFAWFSVGPIVFLVVFTDDILSAIAASAYQEAAAIVPIVAVSMWLSGFTRYLNRHFELRKRFGVLSWITIAGAIINLVLNVALVPVAGMLGAAWATMCNRVFNAVAFFVLRDREIVTIPYRTFALALLWSSACWLVSNVVATGPIVQMAVFVALYAPVALVSLRR